MGLILITLAALFLAVLAGYSGRPKADRDFDPAESSFVHTDVPDDRC